MSTFGLLLSIAAVFYVTDPGRSAVDTQPVWRQFPHAASTLRNGASLDAWAAARWLDRHVRSLSGGNPNHVTQQQSLRTYSRLTDHHSYIAADFRAYFDGSPTSNITPKHLESLCFKAIAVLAVVVMLRVLYSLQLRQSGERIRDRMQERQRERQRIARDLHDNLLQGFQGVVLRFQAATDLIPVSMRAHGELEASLDLADKVLADGRKDALKLRDSNLDWELSDILARFAAELLAPSTRCETEAEGLSRPLHPLVREEVMQIAREALLNAGRHAAARRVEILVVYHPREFRLLVRDDGVGIVPEVIGQSGRQPHSGLVGMRKRALRISADLVISSRPGSGTDVGLTLPRWVAYSERVGPRRSATFFTRTLRFL